MPREETTDGDWKRHLFDFNKALLFGPCGLSEEDREDLINELEGNDELKERCRYLFPDSRLMRKLSEDSDDGDDSVREVELVTREANLAFEFAREVAVSGGLDACAEEEEEEVFSLPGADDTLDDAPEGTQIVRFDAWHDASDEENEAHPPAEIPLDDVEEVNEVSTTAMPFIPVQRRRSSIIPQPLFLHKVVVLTEEEKAKAEAFTFDMSLGPLGVDVAHSRESLLVWQVKKNGQIDTWNKKHYGTDMTIGVGDQVLSVNEQTASDQRKPKFLSALLRDLHRSGQEATLTVLKRAPEFKIELSKQTTAPRLGIDCLISRDGRVLVQKVRNGLLAQWSRRDPRKCVCIGDEIEEADGVRGEDIVVALNAWVKDFGRPLHLSMISAPAVVDLPVGIRRG